MEDFSIDVLDVIRERIKRRRMGIRRTQAEIAKSLRISPLSYSQMERSSSFLAQSHKRVKELARVLCTTVSYLLGECDDPDKLETASSRGTKRKIQTTNNGKRKVAIAPEMIPVLQVRIKARRKELGFSQAKISALVGVDTSTYNKWENDAIRLVRQEKKIDKLAMSLYTTKEYLLGISEEKGEIPDWVIQEKAKGKDKTENFWGILMPNRLQARRKELGLTGTDAANVIGITHQAYRMYEIQPERERRKKTIEQLAKGLYTTYDFLTGKTDVAGDIPPYILKQNPERHRNQEVEKGVNKELIQFASLKDYGRHLLIADARYLHRDKDSGYLYGIFKEFHAEEEDAVWSVTDIAACMDMPEPDFFYEELSQLGFKTRIFTKNSATLITKTMLQKFIAMKRGWKAPFNKKYTETQVTGYSIRLKWLVHWMRYAIDHYRTPILYHVISIQECK